MALRTARLRPDGRPDQRRAGFAGLLLLIALGIALGGCGDTVETYRSLAGVNKNDPDPESAPFTHNLAAGEAEPYPNVGSFPPLPTRATTTAERQKLAQSLVADRAATADAGPALPLQTTGAAPPPAAAPANIQSSNAASATPPAAPAASAPSRTASNSPQSGRRPAGQPPEPGPQDSTLQTPEIRRVPEPEATRPPPPPPVLSALPEPVAGAEPQPASMASAMPQPAPPVPVLTPVAPPPAPVKPVPQHPLAATTVATLEIPAAAAEPNGEDRSQIARVAALYKDNPGMVRVLAYAAPPAGGGDPLDSYRAALEGAQAVAKALANAGIPANKIQTEAAPAAGARAPGRVEIQLTP